MVSTRLSINSMVNGLSKDLRDVIIDTRSISGYCTMSDSENFVNNDKLYLLSTKEIFDDNEADTASQFTRQLDYYKEQGVTDTENFIKAYKQYEGVYTAWWTRTPYNSSENGNGIWNIVGSNADLSYGITAQIYHNEEGLALAFRIG